MEMLTDSLESLLIITEWKEYCLSKLPPGYALFEQQRPPEQTEQRDKADVYLCGSSTIARFRSPREFFEHAHWLMKGKTEPCRCQWCYTGYIRPRQIKHVRPWQPCGLTNLTNHLP